MCGKKGHLRADCPTLQRSTSGGGGGANNMECYQCGKKGHMRAECPQNQPRCWTCGGNHLARVCYCLPIFSTPLVVIALLANTKECAGLNNLQNCIAGVSTGATTRAQSHTGSRRSTSTPRRRQRLEEARTRRRRAPAAVLLWRCQGAR